MNADPLNTRTAEIEARLDDPALDKWAEMKGADKPRLMAVQLSEDICFLLAALQTAREALAELYEWSKDYDAYTPAQNRAAAALAPEQTEGDR